MSLGAGRVDVKRATGWFPDAQDDLEAWLAGHAERAQARAGQPLRHRSVQAFAELIETDPVVGMYVQRMIDQVPTGRQYSKRHLSSIGQLLRLIDEVLTVAPGYGSQTVTLPLGGILDWAMGTPAGYAAFRDPRVNAAVKAILQQWCEFLSSPQSLYVLNDSPTGWTCQEARQTVGIEQYEHDPKDPHWGFTSWNHFFTRRFRDGQRPVAAPDDDKVIVSACESTPYNLRTDVALRDRFWIKDEPYSLQDLLFNDPAVPQFIGGTWLSSRSGCSRSPHACLHRMSHPATTLPKVRNSIISSSGASTHCLVYPPGAVGEFRARLPRNGTLPKPPLSTADPKSRPRTDATHGRCRSHPTGQRPYPTLPLSVPSIRPCRCRCRASDHAAVGAEHPTMPLRGRTGPAISIGFGSPAGHANVPTLTGTPLRGEMRMSSALASTAGQRAVRCGDGGPPGG